MTASAAAAAAAAHRDGDLKRFLAEDRAGGDITGRLVPNRRVAASIVLGGSRAPKGAEVVVSGARHAARIFAMRRCTAWVLVADGRAARRGAAVVAVSGPARQVLACERTALNLMSRMSGIATATRRIVDALAGTGVEVLATRKTAPGLRAFDKEAVECGGGRRHRMSLGDAVLIKDNHIAVAGRVGALVRAAAEKRAAGRGRWAIEAEAETAKEAVDAAAAGADVVMLDNLGPPGAAAAIAALKRAGLRESVKVEASGGITERNAARYAASGVDSISVGALTHSVKGVDYTLVVDPAA